MMSGRAVDAMNDEVVQRLLAAKGRAANIAQEAVRASREGALSSDGLVDALDAYVRAKYHVTREDCASGSLEELSSASVRKMQELGPGAAALQDSASNCDGADSAAVKHAYLMLAIQKDFGVKLDPFQVAFAKTVEELACLMEGQLIP